MPVSPASASDLPFLSACRPAPMHDAPGLRTTEGDQHFKRGEGASAGRGPHVRGGERPFRRQHLEYIEEGVAGGSFVLKV